MAQISIAQKDRFLDISTSYTVTTAGPEYKRSSFHEMLWGRNYRREWSTKVKVPVILLDTTKED